MTETTTPEIGFPDNYTPPASNSDNFLKFKKAGKYYLRILSSPLIGYEYWSKAPGEENAKPIRTKTKLQDSELIHPEVREGKKSFSKEFYAFKVFVYDDNTRKTGSIKVLSTSVRQIMDGIRSFMSSPDYPRADKYDIVIEKQGEGKNTKYIVSRLDSSDQSMELQEANATTKVHLEALFENKDPFDIGASIADGVF